LISYSANINIDADLCVENIRIFGYKIHIQ
jgi:hypothetical protein